MATTLAWRTRPQMLVTFLGRAGAPHGTLVAYDRHGTERERESERERERGIGHIFGANSWEDVGIHKYVCYI